MLAQHSIAHAGRVLDPDVEGLDVKHGWSDRGPEAEAALPEPAQQK